MRNDLKAMLIVTGIIVVFFLFTRSCGVGSIEVAEQDNRDSDISSEVDEIERILKETPEQSAEDTAPSPVRMPVYTGRDEKEPLVISHGTPRSEAKTDNNGAESLERESREPPATIERENQANRKDTVSEEEDSELRAKLAEEEKLTDQFLFSLAEELRPNMTAAQVRAKAYNIREEASAIRDNAQKLDPQLKSAMLERAKVMEDYATRLSATRGNARKLRILIYDLGNQQ
ncbi:MAG: hypothetical protein ACP5G4_12050 [bacterium]